jgi:hypothetical protein
MTPERLYEICLFFGSKIAHDRQSAEAAANYAAAEIWMIPNKPADAHDDERAGGEGIWWYWARYYVGNLYDKEHFRRDMRLLVDECDATPTEWDPQNKDDSDYIEQLAGRGDQRRPVELRVEARETKDELYAMIQGDLLTPAQHKAIVMAWQGLSPEEIGEANGYSRKHAHDLLTGARNRLRERCPDIGDLYQEYLLKKRPIHKYRNQFASYRDPDTTLAYNLRKGVVSLHGRKARQ